MPIKSSLAGLAVCIVGILMFGCATESQYPPSDHKKLAAEYFQEDSAWYLDNIPFFECSDKEIEQVYYYRWKLYKAHIRNVGDNQTVITEFINDVHWDIDPYSTINAATMHHIYEGRWLKDNRVMDGYINYMYQNGGNNRQYSESIADAAYARYLVNADSSFLIRQLDSMKQSFNGWYDHYDSSKNLYYIPAMPDATEYTIASIDASGGKDGFEGGDAFRPTLNSYMYGNAIAIAHIARLKGDIATSNEYFQKAASIKANIQGSVWNDSLQHFTDRFKVNNQYVHYWDFIRGRELAGFAPWYFNLPDDSPRYSAAWKHLLDTSQLLGQYGLRTNEPSYEYYFKQYVFTFGKPGSQWNGPSWPYQTSQAITGMANLLNNYKQDIVSASDYLKILRLFTRQHFLPDGKIDLVENYDPNKGGPIVHFYWSNHYNHSSFNNLVISGLCGIRPSEGDTLVVNPLIDQSIHYFRLDDVQYHGHNVSVIYDDDGSKYKIGKGLSVFVDGKKAELINVNGKSAVVVGKPIIHQEPKRHADFALNIRRDGYPAPSASINTHPDSILQAIDGRVWYFPEITNRWTTAGSASTTDWYAVDFGQTHEISVANIYLYADGKEFAIPDSLSLEYKSKDQWVPVKLKEQLPVKLIGNTVNVFKFDKVPATGLRINFHHGNKPVALVELECH